MKNNKLEFKTANDLYKGDKYIGAVYSKPYDGFQFIVNGFGALTVIADIDAETLAEAKRIVLENCKNF